MPLHVLTVCTHRVYSPWSRASSLSPLRRRLHRAPSLLSAAFVSTCVLGSLSAWRSLVRMRVRLRLSATFALQQCPVYPARLSNDA